MKTFLIIIIILGAAIYFGQPVWQGMFNKAESRYSSSIDQNNALK